VFYLAGGYKYAMSGEGVAFLHAPPDFAPEPEVTGWYAEFANLERAPSGVGFPADARRFLGATFDPSGLYRFLAVRRMLAAVGLTTARVNAHVGSLRATLLPGLADTPLAGAELLNPPGADPQARFLAFRSPHAAAWAEALIAQDVIVDVRGDILRVGLALYQDMGDVEQFAQRCRHL
jgi:selenocysteine lyase/cysteine desulfurase